MKILESENTRVQARIVERHEGSELRLTVEVDLDVVTRQSDCVGDVEALFISVTRFARPRSQLIIS